MLVLRRRSRSQPTATCAGPHGYLITRVRHLKHTYKHYIGVDACMADLMRPGMYGAYHHITLAARRRRGDDGRPCAAAGDQQHSADADADANGVAREAECASELQFVAPPMVAVPPAPADSQADFVFASDSAVFDVTGSLCENNDKFAVDRTLPAEVAVGDVLVLHCCGAHGHAMGFQYNGKLRHAEYLLHPRAPHAAAQADCPNSLVFAGRRATMIRRAETIEDLFATIVWPQ